MTTACSKSNIGMLLKYIEFRQLISSSYNVYLKYHNKPEVFENGILIRTTDKYEILPTLILR